MELRRDTHELIGASRTSLVGTRHESRDSQPAPPTQSGTCPRQLPHSSTAGGTAIYPCSQHAHTEKSALHWLDFGRRGPLLHGAGVRWTAIGSESTADPPKNRHEGCRRGLGGNWTMPSGACASIGRCELRGRQNPEARQSPYDRSFSGRQLRRPPKVEAYKRTQVAPLGFWLHVSVNEGHLFPNHQWTLPMAI
jgi:hypothetical protein